MPPELDSAARGSLRDLLTDLGRTVRQALLDQREATAQGWADVAEESAADTIYAVDKLSEEAILAWFSSTWPREHPVAVVMEGIDDAKPPVFPEGTPADEVPLTCIIDPIDGTRNLMYDKRSAWFVAGLATRNEGRSTLADIFACALVELPTSKQTLADELAALTGAAPAFTSRRRNLITGEAKTLPLRPSRARDLRHGFGSLVKFFPEGKELTARIEERLASKLGLTGHPSPLLFDDQYMTTGGQLYEMAAGRDRFLADLRPLVLPAVGLETALTCHPYDIGAWPILPAVGGLIEKPDGTPLDAPLDTVSPVAWVAYANATLAEQIRPALQETLAELLP